MNLNFLDHVSKITYDDPPPSCISDFFFSIYWTEGFAIFIIGSLPGMAYYNAHN